MALSVHRTRPYRRPRRWPAAACPVGKGQSLKGKSWWRINNAQPQGKRKNSRAECFSLASNLIAPHSFIEDGQKALVQDVNVARLYT